MESYAYLQQKERYSISIRLHLDYSSWNEINKYFQVALMFRIHPLTRDEKLSIDFN